MTIITINNNEFDLAIFKVGNALHVTVNTRLFANKELFNHFKRKIEPSLIILNEYTRTFKELPTEWHERIVKKLNEQDKSSLIIIVK
jgi:hypothetical protein